MDKAVLERTMLEAERELSELSNKLADYELLVQRRVALQSLLNVAKSLLPATQNGHGPTEKATLAKEIRPSKSTPIWTGARVVLAATKRPMTVPEIVTEMRASSWRLESKHAAEIVRGAIIRREETFEAVGRGRYALREWTSEQKKIQK